MTLTTFWTLAINKRINSTERVLRAQFAPVNQGMVSCITGAQQPAGHWGLWLPLAAEEVGAVLSSIPETALDEISAWILTPSSGSGLRGWHCAAHYSPLAMYRWPENLTHSPVSPLWISPCSKSSLERTITTNELKWKWIFGSEFMISFACCPLLPAKPLAQV